MFGRLAAGLGVPGGHCRGTRLRAAEKAGCEGLKSNRVTVEHPHIDFGVGAMLSGGGTERRRPSGKLTTSRIQIPVTLRIQTWRICRVVRAFDPSG